ncbi:MAG: glycosyltransferase [Candidatus Heimdallarchaeota archaeon]|nr:glycosyltransferase [Candidatus Heimdallarchaeota archaeon]
MTDGTFIRPDYGLKDPNAQRNIKPRLYIILMFLAFIFLISYTVYVVDSYRAIFRESSVSAILNASVFTIEMLIGYYSILLFVHFAKGFAPITHPLDERYTMETINNEDQLPTVSILMPMYKEPLNIVKQTILAALDINYPKSKLEWVVVDDSEENPELEEYCKEVNIRYVTRDNRKGFKAGGINNALRSVTSEYTLFIDADHIVERNIIKNCLLAFRENSIAVQTRIDFVNMRTFLTTISAFLQLQFFSLFQRARRPSGSAIFAGGATLFDTLLLKSYGGFDPLTIADDTDNSFIYRANGHRIEYIDEVGAWALVPWDPLHLIRQIWRWMTGITRSFRARWLTILRGKSPLYVKLDHFAVGFFPTLAVFGWGVAFVFIYLIISDISIIRSSMLSNPFFGALTLLISALSIITGTLAVLLDDKKILIHKKPVVYKASIIFAFYLLILTAQPLLLGAIFKGLTGIKVSFNRTPKEKNTGDNITRVKRQYLYYTSIIFLIGLSFLYFGLSIPITDSRAITLLISAWAAIIPLCISLLWYWKLEGYLDEVADITAIEVLRAEAGY